MNTTFKFFFCVMCSQLSLRMKESQFYVLHVALCYAQAKFMLVSNSE